MELISYTLCHIRPWNQLKFISFRVIVRVWLILACKKDEFGLGLFAHVKRCLFTVRKAYD